ncbi:MAG: hypothetical protein ACFFD1_07515 [Candidatus Thorarchaeota archaeon]
MKKILSIILVNKAKIKSVISFLVIISTLFFSCKEKEPTVPGRISVDDYNQIFFGKLKKLYLLNI